MNAIPSALLVLTFNSSWTNTIGMGSAQSAPHHFYAVDHCWEARAPLSPLETPRRHNGGLSERGRSAGPPAGRRGFTRQPENSKRAHFRAPALQKHHQISTKRGKKARNFGPHPSDGPKFRLFFLWGLLMEFGGVKSVGATVHVGVHGLSCEIPMVFA